MLEDILESLGSAVLKCIEDEIREHSPEIKTFILQELEGISMQVKEYLLDKMSGEEPDETEPATHYDPQNEEEY